jgi:hypothetical protein
MNSPSGPLLRLCLKNFVWWNIISQRVCWAFLCSSSSYICAPWIGLKRFQFFKSMSIIWTASFYLFLTFSIISGQIFRGENSSGLVAFQPVFEESFSPFGHVRSELISTQGIFISTCCIKNGFLPWQFICVLSFSNLLEIIQVTIFLFSQFFYTCQIFYGLFAKIGQNCISVWPFFFCSLLTNKRVS